MKADLAASIHARLSARAKTRGEMFQEVLTRYGIERFLYRLSLTPARSWLTVPCMKHQRLAGTSHDIHP